MLGRILGHSDERALLYELFLAAAPAAAARMLRPALWRLDLASGTFQEVPPVDMALQSGEKG